MWGENMRYSLDNVAFDSMQTPVIICDALGMVVYKNEVAVKLVRLPKRRSSILIHLDRAGKGAYDHLINDSHAAIISVYTGDKNAKAFAIPYEYQGVNCTLWLFPGFLQAHPSSTVFSVIEKEIERISDDFCNIIVLMTQRATLSAGKSTNAINKKVEKKFDHMLTTLLESDTKRMQVSIRECMRLLDGQLSEIFEQNGYYIDLTNEISPDIMGKYLNFRDFLAFYSHAMTFCCEQTRSNRISLKATSDKRRESISFTASFTLFFPPTYIAVSDDFTELIKYFPTHYVDLFILVKLTQLCGYHITYSITDSYFDNFVISFEIPIYTRTGFSAPKSTEREFRLLEADCLLFMESVFELMMFAAQQYEEENKDE